ncbi:MAG TPA: hypothetical protein VGI39_45905 [Polyangiaceae bacterium]
MRVRRSLRGANRALLGLLGLAAFLVPDRARAADPNDRTAEHLFREARALIAHKDYAAACPMLEESQRLDPAPGTEFNLARCYELEGRIASATRTYAAVAEAMRGASEPRREKVALDRIAAIAPRLSFVRISLPQGLSAQVTLDGRELAAGEIGAPVPVDRGTHAIAASAVGKHAWDTKVAVEAEGASVAVAVPLLEDAAAPASPPAPSFPEEHPASEPVPAPAPPVQEVPVRPPARASLGTQRLVALPLGGLAIVAAGVGGFYGIEAIVLGSNHQVGESHTDGDISTVTFVAAGTLATAALVLWFTAPSPSTKSVMLVPGLGRDPSIFLSGRF